MRQIRSIAACATNAELLGLVLISPHVGISNSWIAFEVDLGGDGAVCSINTGGAFLQVVVAFLRGGEHRIEVEVALSTELIRGVGVCEVDIGLLHQDQVAEITGSIISEDTVCDDP